eukprot:6215502-Prymnesium_polylepis.1
MALIFWRCKRGAFGGNDTGPRWESPMGMVVGRPPPLRDTRSVTLSGPTKHVIVKISVGCCPSVELRATTLRYTRPWQWVRGVAAES